MCLRSFWCLSKLHCTTAVVPLSTRVHKWVCLAAATAHTAWNTLARTPGWNVMNAAVFYSTQKLHGEKQGLSIYYLLRRWVPKFHLNFLKFHFNYFLKTLFHAHWYNDVRFSWTGATDSCELPCGCWELNPGPLEEQSVLLTTGPSHQPLTLNS